MTTEPKRGFAALSPERRREVSSAGGKAAQNVITDISAEVAKMIEEARR